MRGGSRDDWFGDWAAWTTFGLDGRGGRCLRFDAGGVQRGRWRGACGGVDEDASSPLYHHFLTVQQFDARFGLPASTVTAIREWLAKAGMKLQSVTGNHDLWTVTGTATRVDAWLHTKISNYVNGKTRFFASADRLTVPAALPILGFTGLDNYPSEQLAPMFSRALRGGALVAAERSAARDASSDSSSTGVETTYSPQDLWKIYQYPDRGRPPGLLPPVTSVRSLISFACSSSTGVCRRCR